MRTRFYMCALLLLSIAGVTEASTSAWALGLNPTTSSYAAPPTYSYNPAGGAITITRSTTVAGAYNVKFHGLGPMVYDNGNVQVTPYGPGPFTTVCRVSAWN